MGNPRRVLGRGLDALIPSHSLAVHNVKLADVVPGANQPRTEFDDDSLRELAASITAHGIIQPLVVSPLDGDGKRRLIAGERRWQAARLAGLDTVPAIEREAGPQSAVEIALVENIQREDLSPLDEAAAFERLSREHGLSQEEIAGRVGRSRSSVANTMRLTGAPYAVRQALRERTITEGHARALLMLIDGPELEQALARVIDEGLNVRQTEQLAARLKKGVTPRAEPVKPPEIERLEDDLRQSLGTKVSVLRGRKAGRIVIEFYSDEELAALTERMLAVGQG